MEPLSWGEILLRLAYQFMPVWIALALTFGLSIAYKRRLGLYGKLFDNVIGMVGFAIVMFWVYTALFVGLFDWIITHDPLSAVSGMKNKVPGTPLRGAEAGDYPYYLLGGDTLARDVFSRMVQGSWVVIRIAPLATLFAFMAGITLGLPAGYFGGRLDTVLSFLANLILAFPVILLFYLLVTPEMVESGIPSYMAVVLFVLPILFLIVMVNSRFHTQPMQRNVMVAVVLVIFGWLYLSLINDRGTPVNFLPVDLDLFDIPGGILVVFVSVVFVNAPTVFRIVRGLALDQLEGSTRHLVYKEVMVSLLNGLMCGGLMGLFAWYIYGRFTLGVVMMAAMLLNLLLAALVGIATPLVLERAGRDPAQGASVLLTFITDSMGFFLFLGLAKLFLI